MSVFSKKSNPEIMNYAPTFYFAGQTNFGNRGCEALVRSTVTVLQDALGPVNVLVPSHDKVRDQAQWPESSESGVEFVDAPVMPWLLGKWSGACRQFPRLKALPHPQPSVAAPHIADMRRADAVLAIGGDNYSLDYGLANLYSFVAIADAAMAAGKPTVLWGASVGPFEGESRARRRLIEHLRRLTLITVRESHSVEYLGSIGVADNVLQVVDSAFALRPQPVDVQTWWPEEAGDGVLGLNIGWLIDSLRRRAGQREGVVGEVAGFVRDVIARTRFSMILVPHVAPLNGDLVNNDEAFNQQVMQALGGPTPRLAQVPGGLNAAQLKHVISKCRFFIGGRTHATIAAFSSAVPTLSIAYSVKAKGINRDLFGDERYVLETPQLARNTLWSGLELLQREQSAILQRYDSILPAWGEHARAGAYRLDKLLAKNRGSRDDDVTSHCR